MYAIRCKHSDELTGSISSHNISKGALPSDGFTVFNNTPSPVEGGELNEFTKSMGETSYSVLKNLRVKNIKGIIIAHININSIRNKFDTLTDLVTGKIDILLLSDTEVNDSFPSAQFKMPDYTSPYRLDRTNNGGGLLLYIREDIPSKLLDTANVINDINFESLFVEMNLSKSKWLIGGIYNPCRTLIGKHVNNLGMYIDKFSHEYENILIMGDFNSDPWNKILQEFCNLYDMKNVVTEPTCYKNYNQPTCIDLTTTLETGISDFHKMTITVLKSCYRKLPPRIIFFRDKKYSQPDFHRELTHII